MIFRQPDQSFLVPAKGDLFSRYLQRAGASVVQTSSGRIMSLEQILMADPDVFLLLPLSKMSPIDLYSGATFASLRAVRAHRVYRVPVGLQDSFFNNVVDSPLFSRWLAELLYPNKMPRQTRQHMRRLYEKDFGYRISENELDEALALNENKRSVGYERFRR